MADTIHFQYHQAILEKYPSLVGGVILGRDVTNQPSPEALQAAYRAEQQAVIARIGAKPLSELEPIGAWRKVFRSFGIDPTQYRCAAEALLRRLTKQGDIPSINTLVDIGNLISIRYAVPIAVFDTRALTGPITVKLAAGSERFTPLGVTEAEHPEAGEVIFADDHDLVVARRWCWRQSHESAAQVDTRQIVITVEAHHANAQGDVSKAVDDLRGLLRQYVTGEFQPAILRPGQTTAL